jgi:hypothetical protein
MQFYRNEGGTGYRILYTDIVGVGMTDVGPSEGMRQWKWGTVGLEYRESEIWWKWYTLGWFPVEVGYSGSEIK